MEGISGRRKERLGKARRRARRNRTNERLVRYTVRMCCFGYVYLFEVFDWLIDCNLSHSGEDMYSLKAVFIHALVSVRCELFPHPCPLLTRWAGWRVGSNLWPHDYRYPSMAVFIHALVSIWWKLLPHPCPLLTRWAGWRVGSNLWPHDYRYPPMAVFIHALVSIWWKLLLHPCPLLTRWAGRRVGLISQPHDNQY
jgi:hypothetical protein